MELNLITILEYLGTYAFAISGIRMASDKKFDWLGAYVIGLITATGGGTIRDVMLKKTPFWILDPSYLIITGVALLSYILFGKYFNHIRRTLFLFDSIGLGLFVMVGIEKTLSLSFPFWVAVIMGTITGCVGGIMRDVLVNEPPLIFRKDIYALTCIIGGAVYFICRKIGFVEPFTNIIVPMVIILLRVIAVRKNISVPSGAVDITTEPKGPY